MMTDDRREFYELLARVTSSPSSPQPFRPVSFVRVSALLDSALFRPASIRRDANGWRGGALTTTTAKYRRETIVLIYWNGLRASNVMSWNSRQKPEEEKKNGMERNGIQENCGEVMRKEETDFF